MFSKAQLLDLKERKRNSLKPDSRVWIKLKTKKGLFAGPSWDIAADPFHGIQKGRSSK